ncbi:hypothetical protein AMECASPLE_039711 [Ameca splendens]|uniref:Uncharacterized protein n=1 Tax=Ameca splendens TaxID=208324 RepID=A0ABV0Z6V2_9TELE
MRGEGNRKVLQMIRVVMLMRCLVQVLLQGSVQLPNDKHTFITSQLPCSCSSSRIYSDHLYISVRSIQMIYSHSAAAEPEPMKNSLGSGSKPAAAAEPEPMKNSLGSGSKAAAEPEPMKNSLGSGSKAAAALFVLHQHDVWREEAGSLQRHQVLINIT